MAKAVVIKSKKKRDEQLRRALVSLDRDRQVMQWRREWFGDKGSFGITDEQMQQNDQARETIQKMLAK